MSAMIESTFAKFDLIERVVITHGLTENASNRFSMWHMANYIVPWIAIHQ
jgi:hypothetical protein